MSEALQNEKGAFDERIVARQVQVVPNELALERREVNGESEQGEESAAHPGYLPKRAEFMAQPPVSSAG